MSAPKQSNSEPTHNERMGECWGNLVPLFNAAASGDGLATVMLLRIAFHSTRFLECVYAQQPALVKKVVLQQSGHTGGEFPALCSWRKAREAKRKTMLAELNPGSASILKANPKRQTPLWLEVHDNIISLLNFQKAAGKLPPLTIQSIDVWAKAAEMEIMPPGQDATANLWARKIAKPERELAKRKAKARKLLGSKYGSDVLDPIAATKKQEKLKEINARKITDADVRNGFREAVRDCLRRNLKE